MKELNKIIIFGCILGILLSWNSGRLSLLFAGNVFLGALSILLYSGLATSLLLIGLYVWKFISTGKLDDSIIVGIILFIVSAFLVNSLPTVLHTTCDFSTEPTFCKPPLSEYKPKPPAQIFATFQGLDAYEVGDTVVKTLTAEAQPPTASIIPSSNVECDNEWRDGNVSYCYGYWAIYKGGDEFKTGEWQLLDTPEYSHTISESFTIPSKYVYFVVLVKAESTFNPSTGQWNDYTITELDKEAYPFYIIAPEPQSPINQLIEWFSNLIDWVLGLIGF